MRASCGKKRAPAVLRRCGGGGGVKGYRFRRAYIATQGPLAETTEDFWRMLWEHNCNIVVMLTKLREVGRVNSSRVL